MREIIKRLTADQITGEDVRRQLFAFADGCNWHPSDAVTTYHGTERFANGHLLVEHGLESTAVISFLKWDTPFESLQDRERERLMMLSYNNLVDWHVFPDLRGATYVYNRVDPLVPQRREAGRGVEAWSSAGLGEELGRRPRANLPALDDALIDTLSFWKRALADELQLIGQEDALSALFNAALFLRALEDHRRRQGVLTTEQILLDQHLLLSGQDEPRASVGQVMLGAAAQLGAELALPKVVDLDYLPTFDGLTGETVSDFCRDFYGNRFAPYEYDFSLMSKHAMSRIYERYVSLLRPNTHEPSQPKLFPSLLDEVRPTSLGTHYSPQYVARFFGRFLQKEVPPRSFRDAKIADPACGSGMFLRTMAEMQADAAAHGDAAEIITSSLEKLLGIDVDPGACQAAKLSLSLLHLVVADQVPERLDIRCEDALSLDGEAELEQQFDAVIANPPFVPWGTLSAESRAKVGAVLGDRLHGRADAYLAHLCSAASLVRPGGLLMFVLPHSFLVGDNASGVRAWIASEYHIRCIVDLSEVPVFGDVGIYVILLVAERIRHGADPPSTWIVRCRDSAGQALQAVLARRTTYSNQFDVFSIANPTLGAEAWSLTSPKESAAFAKLEQHPPLAEYLDIRVGFISGADSVFIVNADEVADGELAVFRPYLPDRLIGRFVLPDEVRQYVFHPYAGDKKLTAAEIQADYPGVWNYLQERRDELENRGPVRAGKTDWWCPERPRLPKHMLRPKIVTPHLVVIPKFAIDFEGRHAVSRSPLMYPKQDGDTSGMLKYFAAVLNSTVAMNLIERSSHKYSRGYAMLEPKSLKKVRVPAPENLAANLRRKIVSAVDSILTTPGDADLHARLDRLVAEAYRLDDSDLDTLGVELL